jgi:hypothetical protein
MIVRPLGQIVDAILRFSARAWTIGGNRVTYSLWS